MSDERYQGAGPPDDEPVDAGEPIAVLADFDEPVSTGFLTRLRRKIDRRVLTSQFATATWEMPKIILIEFLGMIFEMFQPRTVDKGDGK